MKNIVVIGGKKGIFQVLHGLSNHSQSKNWHITALVSTYDNGGGNGKLREEFDNIPFGDIRGAIIALSQDKNSELYKLFNYRFSKGGLASYSAGSLFLQALTLSLGDEMKAIKKASALLQVKGKVLPVTLDNAHLVATLEDGNAIVGETNIDIPKHNGNLKITSLKLSPKARIYKESAAAITSADYIIIGPGDLYTSLLPNLLTTGFNEALKKSKAKVIYIPNLKTKWGETNNFKASDFAREIENHLSGRKIDYVVCNSKPSPTNDVVVDVEKIQKYSAQVILDNIVSHSTTIKHDEKKLANVLSKIIK